MKRIALLSLMILSVGLALAMSCYDAQYTTTPGTDGTYPSPYAEQTITLENVVVTCDTYGNSPSYLQPKFYVSDPGGGPWSGLYIYRFGTGVVAGDLINITGRLIEYYGMTEISNSPAPTITIISQGNQLPEPALIQTSVLSDPAVPANAEMWESVLCKVQNVTVTAVPNSYAEFYVTDGSGAGQIDDGAYLATSTGYHSWPTGFANIGNQWAQIVGIVDYNYDVYGLNPRQNFNDFSTTANEDNVVILPDAKLLGNFPNPFAGETVIAFNLKSAQPVRIEVFNLKGQKVRTVVESKLGAQLHNVTFDGKDDRGSLLPSGMYMYKMTAGGTVESRKLVIR